MIGPLPEGVGVVIWDGTTEPPDGVEHTEFAVARYPVRQPPAEFLAAMPELRVVQLLSAGVEAWLSSVPEGVVLCAGRGIHGGSTAEIAVAGLLSVVRELPRFLDAQREHRWAPVTTEGLDDAAVLVLGAGDIGRRVAAALAAFGANITCVARRERDGVRSLNDVPRLLPDQDAVIIALPLTPETSGLVDAAFLARMRDGAVLVNVARGPIVDTEALLAEATSGRLRAFLDVVDPEPLPEDHPLWSAPGVLITPHVGGGTQGWQRRAYALVRDQILRFLGDRPLRNVVSAGY